MRKYSGPSAFLPRAWSWPFGTGTRRHLQRQTARRRHLFFAFGNGVKQYMEIEGTSKTKPVRLFIHGEAAWPATPMNRRYSQDMVKNFIFVS